MRLLEVGHELLFALLTKDRHVPKPWEQRPGAPGEGGVRQNVEERRPPAPEGTGAQAGTGLRWPFCPWPRGGSWPSCLLVGP